MLFSEVLNYICAEDLQDLMYAIKHPIKHPQKDVFNKGDKS